MIQIKQAAGVATLALLITSGTLISGQAWAQSSADTYPASLSPNMSVPDPTSSAEPVDSVDSYQVVTQDDLEMRSFADHEKDLLDVKIKPDANSCPGAIAGAAWDDGFKEAVIGEDYDSLCQPRNSPSTSHLNCNQYRDHVLSAIIIKKLPPADRKKITQQTLLSCCRIGYYAGLDRLERYLTKTYSKDNLRSCRGAERYGAMLGLRSCNECFVPDVQGLNSRMLGCLTIGYLKAVTKNCPTKNTVDFAKAHAPSVYNHGKTFTSPDTVDAAQPGSPDGDGARK